MTKVYNRTITTERMFSQEVNIMAELFSNFTSTLVIVGVILALGIIFEKQLIALEDKFDAYVASLRNEKKTSSVSTKKTAAVRKQMTKRDNTREGFAA